MIEHINELLRTPPAPQHMLDQQCYNEIKDLAEYEVEAKSKFETKYKGKIFPLRCYEKGWEYMKDKKHIKGFKICHGWFPHEGAYYCHCWVELPSGNYVFCPNLQKFYHIGGYYEYYDFATIGKWNFKQAETKMINLSGRLHQWIELDINDIRFK